jgi:hypothetical protein
MKQECPLLAKKNVTTYRISGSSLRPEVIQIIAQATLGYVQGLVFHLVEGKVHFYLQGNPPAELGFLDRLLGGKVEKCSNSLSEILEAKEKGLKDT